MLSLLLPSLLLLVGDPGGESTGTPARPDEESAPARPVDWSELDAALARLDGTQGGASPSSAGPLSWGALVRVFYTTSASEASAGTKDISGQVFEDVDLYAHFEQDGVAWRVSADLDDGTARLEDAYGAWRIANELVLEGGQFKPRVVRSGSIPPDALLFRERSFLGAAFDAWDTGLGLLGHYDQFDYWLALSNGANGTQSKPFWSARVEWALFDAAFADVEGARGSPNHLRALLGLTTFGDAGQSSGHGGGYGADLALTFGPWAFHGEYADLDSGFAREIDVFNGYLIMLGDGQPRGATLSRRIFDEAEAAVRIQMADDVDSTRAVDFGLGWTPGGGPARFVADLALVDGDTRDFSLFSLGLQLGTSGQSRPFLVEEESR